VHKVKSSPLSSSQPSCTKVPGSEKIHSTLSPNFSSQPVRGSLRKHKKVNEL
jgi:hypothetical protein